MGSFAYYLQVLKKYASMMIARRVTIFCVNPSLSFSFTYGCN